MRDNRVRLLAEMGLAIALFAVLAYFKIPTPFNLFGGSVSLAMLPIVVLALLRGPWVGLAVGVLCGCIDIMFDPYIVHPAQLILDYPLAYGAVGSAGFLSSAVRRALDGKKTVIAASYTVAAVVFGTAMRFIPAFMSGMIFFGEFAPEGQPVWLYSLLYQLGYLPASALVVSIVAVLVVPVLYSTLGKENA